MQWILLQIRSLGPQYSGMPRQQVRAFGPFSTERAAVEHVSSLDPAFLHELTVLPVQQVDEL